MIGGGFGWPSGDWGDSYEEGMRKLGIDIDATYEDEELDDWDEGEESESDEGDEE